jgi:Recombination endonuclease VII
VGLVALSHYEKYGRKWYEANKEFEAVRGKEYYQRAGKEKKLESYPERRKRILKSRYGITLEQFDELYNKQFGKCAICQQTYHSTLHIDHDHSDGKIRGLLCNNCNLGLGHFKDSSELLENASKYLVKARSDITGHGGSCGV